MKTAIHHIQSELNLRYLAESRVMSEYEYSRWSARIAWELYDQAVSRADNETASAAKALAVFEDSRAARFLR